MSFLWALLPNQMMQWIITTTSLSAALPSCYWNILECHSVVVYCILLSSEVCLPLRFFTVPRVDLWNKLLEFAPWRTKNDRFSQIDCSLYKWLLNILYCNIITLEPILLQARFFFCFLSPFSDFILFYISFWYFLDRGFKNWCILYAFLAVCEKHLPALDLVSVS